MRPSRPFPSLALLLALAACAAPKGSFPSLAPRAAEMERVIEAPGAGVEATLSPEQRASLQADLARESRLLAETEAALRTSAVALDRALAAARGQAIGTEAWSAAQMALSRHDQARSPLDGISARLAPLSRTLDSLPATDPDRAALDSLARRAAEASEGAQRQVDAANRQLGT
jgi:hypothetical protein